MLHNFFMTPDTGNEKSENHGMATHATGAQHQAAAAIRFGPRLWLDSWMPTFGSLSRAFGDATP